MQHSIYYNFYLYFILAIKIIYFIFLFLYFRSKVKHLENQEKLYEIKQFVNNIFRLLLLILMLVLFYPKSHRSIEIEGHTRIFLFTYAILELINFITIFFTN
jgi:hypothetical protein